MTGRRCQRRFFERLHPRTLHRDESGAISLVSVFVILMLAILLVMTVNVVGQIDDRVRMQAAADAAAYSGTTVLARGLNSAAFCNHLTADVFAITAFLREGRDRNAEQLVPDILAAWAEAGQLLSQAPYDKFQRLGEAIVGKVPLEQETVTAYGELTAAASELSLPVFEYILRDELIPEFQRAMIQLTPELAQYAADETAKRHSLNRDGQLWEPERGPLRAVLWQADVLPIVAQPQIDPLQRTLPIVDPTPDGDDWALLPDGFTYLERSVAQRQQLAHFYLDRWNFDRLQLFRDELRLSNYFHLWRIATCAQLDRLLTQEYPTRNLLTVIRETEEEVDLEETFFDLEQRMRMSRLVDEQRPALLELLRAEVDLDRYLERNFHFVAVVYRPHRTELGGRLFRNPLKEAGDATAFSQAAVFIPYPRWRLVPVDQSGAGETQTVINLGGTFGYTSGIELPRDAPARPPQLDPEITYRWALENWPVRWDLVNQNWMTQLVPATLSTLPEIAQTPPIEVLPDAQPPQFGTLSPAEWRTLVAH